MEGNFGSLKEKMEELKDHWSKEKELIQSIREIKEKIEETKLAEQVAERTPTWAGRRSFATGSCRS